MSIRTAQIILKNVSNSQRGFLCFQRQFHPLSSSSPVSSSSSMTYSVINTIKSKYSIVSSSINSSNVVRFWNGYSSARYFSSSSNPLLKSKASTSANLNSNKGSNVDQKIKSALQLRLKSRPVAKKKIGGKDEWCVVGYSTAESLDLLGLQDAIREQEIYTQVRIAEELEPSCLFVTNKFSQTEGEEKIKEIFFYKEGCVIFWNVPELERSSVLKFLKPFTDEGYEDSVVFEESEMMNYRMSSTDKPHLEKGIINIVDEGDILVKYAFSNAISSSVKLGSWETFLEKIIDSIEFISDDLRREAGVKISKDFVLQKTGEILGLRHLLNLSSDFLDTPDFYWDREDLEHLFLATCSHLAVAKRTKVINEKLSHCLEVMDMINNHLSHEHSSRLEWIIIILIAIEIVFEVIHLRLNYPEDDESSQ